MSKSVFALLILFLLMLPALVAQNLGTVQGVITDPSDALISGAKVTLSSAASPQARQTVTTKQGRYSFSNVPLGTFTLRVETRGFVAAEYFGELYTSTTVVHNFHFTTSTTVQQITVSDTAPLLESSASITHRDFSDDDLEHQPMAPAQKGMSAIIETIPGAVPEENGRMHVRGAETQPQVVLDGVPLADNLTGSFATGLDTENLHAAQILTGSMPAEYGDKLSAVVNLTSKSGLDMPLQGALSVSGGSLISQATDVEFGGHAGNFGFFVTADGNHSDRFLDPPEIGNFHNSGAIAHLFTRFDWLPTKIDSLRLSLATDGSDFQVPNTADQQDAGQRQTQKLRDDFQSLAWSRVLSDRTIFDISASRRSSSAAFLDPDMTGTPYLIEQHRRQRTEGIRGKLHHDWRLGQLEAGAEMYRLPISEAFTLAVTDPSVIEDPEEPLAAFTTGNPFDFHDKQTGWKTAGFIQQHFRLGERLTIDAGLRFDYHDLVIQEHAWSPRIGVAYHVLRTGTVFRAAYNRLFQPPPLENLLFSSSTSVAALSNDRPTDTYQPVPSERQNFYEVGVQQRIGSKLRLDVSHYIKNSRNFTDDGQLLSTAIVFPVALTGADVRGTELRLDFAATHGLSAYASYANMKATITTPIVGGIFLGADAGNLFLPGRQPADQDERNEAQFGATYTHRSGAWVSMVGRFDSGLPTDFDPDKLADTDPRVVAQVDTLRRRIKPRTVMNLVGGIELMRESPHPVALQLGVNNLFDQLYLYNFYSAYSGTHIGRPREVIGRVVFRWSSGH